MATRVVKFNRNNLMWAIRRADRELDEIILQFPKLEEWIRGDENPTVKQLEKFTKKLNVPFGYMFVENVPEETLNFPFFRTGAGATNKVSLNVYHTIQLLKDRQNWLIEYLQEADYEPLDFVGRFNLNSDYLEVVEHIRTTLSLQSNWASRHASWEKALDYLTFKIEDAGIIVTFNGVVENNTRRKIDVNECRGFVLVNNYAPFLFVNAADAKAAQMFTIIHELAHIWVGQSAGFNFTKMIPADDPLELLCDQIAAEFLVPADLLINNWREERIIENLSKRFKVSPIVIGRRLLDLGLIERREFFGFYNNYIESIKRKKETQGDGGNFYATARKRISLRFANFISNAVKENKLLYRDAYKLTSLYGDTYSRFMKEQLLQS